MKTTIFAILLLAVTILSACSTAQVTGNGVNEASNAMVAKDSAGTVDMVIEDNVPTDKAIPDKTFVLDGGNYYFEMDGVRAPELRVKQGEIVQINLMSVDGFHDVVIDEFGAATERVQTGGETTVTFVADKKGTFEYYCSVGQHRQNGMFGNLIVE